MQKERYFTFLLCFALLLGMIEVPFHKVLAKSSVSVSTDSLNVREGPGLSHKVVAEIHRGESFPVIKEEGEWIQIDLGLGKTGWIVNWLVSENTGTSSNLSEKSEPDGFIKADSLRVRTGPGTDYEVRGSLKEGDAVNILSEKDGWMEIEFSNQTGWILGEFVKKNASESNENSNEKETPLKNSTREVRGTATASLKVRDAYTFDGEVIGTISKGEVFDILEEKNGWVKIEFKSKKFGWIAEWYVEKSNSNGMLTSSQEIKKESMAKILHNGTNIRKGPGVNTQVITRVNKGEAFPIISIKNNWYEVRLDKGQSGYIAGWVVSVSGGAPQIEKPGTVPHLLNKTIMIDPGHGGRDNGATGSKGTLEKNLTLQTGQILYDKLRSAGARAILTRHHDHYLSLNSRVDMSLFQHVDAFISLHYDSIEDETVKGITSYFFYPYQQPLATNIHKAMNEEVEVVDRGVRHGNYYVLRENEQNAVLVELGYLSNPSEELLVSSSQYQDEVTTGIFRGLVNYFKRY